MKARVSLSNNITIKSKTLFTTIKCFTQFFYINQGCCMDYILLKFTATWSEQAEGDLSKLLEIFPMKTKNSKFGLN